MNKDELRMIRQLAEILPTQLRLERHTTKFSGKGLIKEGFKADENKIYFYSLPVAVKVNHEEAMKAAFEKDGPKGVGAYSQRIIDLKKSGELKKRNEEIINIVAIEAEKFREKTEQDERRAAWNRTWIARAIKFIKSIIHKIKIHAAFNSNRPR